VTFTIEKDCPPAKDDCPAAGRAENKNDSTANNMDTVSFGIVILYYFRGITKQADDADCMDLRRLKTKCVKTIFLNN
jgi:hypothetical protein